jgi:hypothetical protein
MWSRRAERSATEATMTGTPGDSHEHGTRPTGAADQDRAILMPPRSRYGRHPGAGMAIRAAPEQSLCLAI